MRVFCDANVLFAAAISPHGRSAALFELASTGGHRLLMSPYPVEEARRNVSARYPDSMGRLEGDLMPLLDMVPEATASVLEAASGAGLPVEDAPILAAAIAASADLLVTGDRRHFGHLFGRAVAGVAVSSLADAVARLSG